MLAVCLAYAAAAHATAANLVLCPRNDRSFLFPASRCSAAGFNLLKRVTTASVFSENRIKGRSPDEWFGLLVPRLKELADGSMQIIDATECAAAYRLAGQFCKPTLHQIQP